ncbi:transcription factor 3 [Alternaria burnsii]|uniref:Transcription factor 3 n=1 Tax=Alternaria burnsii TaxID=1187904 RepID=A0A8H7EKM6_9PLEO|nr:transcription factor 3 [Alternaria burnsii]KAF7679239.1 transcription factor 3 [Alternaria burnsii]
MADEKPPQLSIEPVSRPLDLIPVVIKEAALDSPTFRATAVHYGDQIELIERWLTSFVTATSKLAAECNNMQALVDTYIQASHPPLQLSEAVVDHDYTVLALKRFGEGAREFWNGTLRSIKRAEQTMCEPMRAFVSNDLRMLKEARKNLDSTQRTFDGAIARYAGQVKTKEASSLREDAFQLHEARRAYLQASMNFCVMAPQVRLTLDKILVKVVNEQWKDMKAATEASSKGFGASTSDVERVRGWSKEMENGERVFKRELHLARQQIEGAAEVSARPSRDLDTYAASTVPYLGTAPSSANLQSPAKPEFGIEKAEKQGWLFQRTITGKPARTYWVRRWFFVKNGIFGWLTQGTRSGAVEESEKIGVLLCGIRPAFAEERRFCFEVKTKDTTILLQAETQNDITEWISSFEVAKRKALEDTSKDLSGAASVDAAFSISPPIAPEFAAKTSEGHAGHPGEDTVAMDRTETLGIPGGDGNATRGSFDVSSRRGTTTESDSSRRDHTARIMEKLDLTRKSTVSPQLSGSNPSSASGGIASLISASLASASHNIVQVGQIAAPAPGLPDTRLVMGQTLPYTSLAPSTLASPPAPTNLSKAAVAVSGERGLGTGRSGNMPGGLMANLWGSVNWGYVNVLGREEETNSRDRSQSGPPSPINPSPVLGPSDEKNGTEAAPTVPASAAHRKSSSMGGPIPILNKPNAEEVDFPTYYPLALRMQDAQFRILFPTVPRAEKVVLVFRAVWNPTEQQEFPGRVYVTTKNIYFYSNHLGLVLITGISMASIDEVTAAPGKDCDFLFLHFKSGSREDGATRLTVKTFLEPLKLLLRRLNFLVRNTTSREHNLEETIKGMIKMETDESLNSAGEEGWEEISPDTPIDPNTYGGGKNIKASLRIDGNLFGPSGASAGKNATKFKLPSQAVVFAPAGMTQVAVEKEYDISAKGLFHILFGDKSAVFQLLYRERRASRIVQGPWITSDKNLQRRDFEYEVAQPGKNGAIVINDYQVIEVLNDHLCYVVSDRKTPWYLPGQERFVLLSKTVITHVSKARCKLAIHTKVDWKRNPRFAKKLIERQALQDLELEAQDLVDVVNDQVARLGHNRSTNKVTGIFGQIGAQTQAVQLDAQDIPPPNRPRKFKLRPQTTASFVAQYIGNIVISVLSTVMSWILAIGAGFGKVISAHSLLFGLLLVSGGANFFYTSRDSWSWWHERNAANYMSRLGVKPSTTMTRSIYIRDIEESFLNRNSTGLEFSVPVAASTDNKCQTTAAMAVIGMTCKLTDDSVVVNGDLKISFRRTVRVPETKESNWLPPDLGAFPLKPVSQHSKSLPPGMAVKGGVFFPMYQYEAMWINFSTVHEDMLPYMIKIYVGGVNVVSAQTAMESTASRSRRQVRLQTTPSNPKPASPLQDYVVVPGQKWIDGIANGDGTIFLKQLDGSAKTFNVTNLEPIENFKLRIREATGIPTSIIRLIYADRRTFEDYRISKEATIHMVLRLRGAGSLVHISTPEMNTAAGGLIKQVIHRDIHPPNWDTTKTTVFNAQILNSMLYQAVTGARPLVPSILHERYIHHGLPYYKMYEELSNIYSNFDMVKSVGQITGKIECKVVTKAPRIVKIGKDHENVSPPGPPQVSHTMFKLEDALESYHIPQF